MANKNSPKDDVKEVKTFKSAGVSFDKRVDLIDDFISNMKTLGHGSSRTGILLAGDPGVGKTTFMEFFVKFIGMELIIIEAPHITEEHVINIPFIVFSSDGKQSHKETKLDINKTEMILADSNLYTTLAEGRIVSDKDLIKHIYSGPKDFAIIWETLGGDETKVPKEIADVRKKFKNVLFLDEYYRQTSDRVKNILRGILNGKIGLHDIPAHTFTTYASNMKDDGVSAVPANNDFRMIDMDVPSKDEWFAYLVNKFENHEHIKLDDKIIQKFYNLLEEEHLSHKDLEADVRTSPRRWEQLLLYINSSIPPQSEKEAKALVANVNMNFKNYLSGKQSKIGRAVAHAVQELVHETSDFKVSLEGTDPREWKSVLEHQIQTKMKLGDSRKYIPVISGLPGIGKTSAIGAVASDMNLFYIYIDCSTIEIDDSTGIPMAEKGDKSYSVKFSMPKLYKQIMDDIERQEEAFLADLKAEKGAAAVKEFKGQRWKYLIFFDELTRTSTKVFNAIRKLLLEKKFSEEFTLPKESIIIAAINPEDIGANELTSHVRDVVDIIDTKPSWDYQRSFILDNMKTSDRELCVKVLNAVEMFIAKFKSRDNSITRDEEAFYIDVGNTVYISPREYTTIVSNAVEKISMKQERLSKQLRGADTDEITEIQEKIAYQSVHSFYDVLSSVLKTVMVKQDSENPVFLHDLKTWCFKEDLSLNPFIKHVDSVMSFSDIMNHYYGAGTKDISDEIEFNNYLENTDVEKFKSDIVKFLLEMVSTDEEIEFSMKKIDYKAKKIKAVDDGSGKRIADFVEEESSKIEHFVNGIIHAIFVGNFQHEFLEAVKIGFRDFLVTLNKEKNDKQSSELFSKINSAILRNLREIRHIEEDKAK